MDLMSYVKQGIEIVKLNTKAIEKVAKDKNATNIAILFFAIGGCASSLWTTGLVGLIPVGIFAALFSFVGVGINHFLAKMVGGKGEFWSLYRATGIGAVINWLSFIPAIGMLISLWGIVINVVNLKTIYKLSTGKAVFVVLVPVVIMFVIGFVIAMMLAGTIMAGLLGSGSLDALMNMA